MVFIPTAFLLIVPVMIVEVAWAYYYYLADDIEAANYYFGVAYPLFKTVSILGPVTNLFSCLILALVIRLIFKLSKQV